MTTPLNPLEPAPPSGNTDWYADYVDIHSAVTELQAVVAALVPVNGPVITVNGLAPDPSGDVELTYGDVGAMPAGYAPSFSDLVVGATLTVDKDPTTGNWPAAWDVNNNPIYAGGAPNQGARPIANPSVTVRWRGAEPSPGSVASGTGGMLRGKDERVIPG